MHGVRKGSVQVGELAYLVLVKGSMVKGTSKLQRSRTESNETIACTMNN
jgi:hypothetical protein